MWRTSFVGVLFLVGCTDIESSSILTSGIYAGMSVIAPGDGTSTATVVLHAGGQMSTNYVELTGDDRLTAAAGDAEPVELQGAQLFDYHSYHAQLSTDDPATTFTVSFERTIDEGAPSSTAQLPDPFTLDPAPDSASRAEDLTITWTPSGTGDPMTITAEGDCVALYVDTASDDPGTYTFPANGFEMVEGQESATCALNISVQRTRAGTIDPGFGEGGHINGIQQRSVVVSSMP